MKRIGVFIMDKALVGTPTQAAVMAKMEGVTEVDKGLYLEVTATSDLFDPVDNSGAPGNYVMVLTRNRRDDIGMEDTITVEAHRL